MGVLNIVGRFVITIMGYIVDSTGGNYNIALMFLVLFPFIGAVSYAGLFRNDYFVVCIILLSAIIFQYPINLANKMLAILPAYSPKYTYAAAEALLHYLDRCLLPLYQSAKYIFLLID